MCGSLPLLGGCAANHLGAYTNPPRCCSQDRRKPGNNR